MTLTLRKVRNKNEYVIKDDGKIVKTLESREEAVDYFVKYREELGKKVEKTENKVKKKAVKPVVKK